MNEKKTQTNGLRIRVLGVAGAAAFVSVGALSLLHTQSNSTTVEVAGSGDAPTNTVYVQPTEKAFDMGATATWTTPSAAAPTGKAVPPLGGG